MNTLTGGVNSNTQMIGALQQKTTKMRYYSDPILTYFEGDLFCSGNFNNTTPTKLDYISTLSSNAQTQLNVLNTKCLIFIILMQTLQQMYIGISMQMEIQMVSRFLYLLF